MNLKRRLEKLEKYAPSTGDYEVYLTHEDSIAGKVSRVTKKFHDEHMAKLRELVGE